MMDTFVVELYSISFLKIPKEYWWLLLSKPGPGSGLKMYVVEE